MALEQIGSKTGLPPATAESVIASQQVAKPVAQRRGKTAMTDAEKKMETPFSHFERLGVPRTESILNGFRLLSNLAGRIRPNKDMTGWKQYAVADEETGENSYFWTDETGRRLTNAYTIKDLEFVFGLIDSARNDCLDALKHARAAAVKGKLVLPTT